MKTAIARAAITAVLSMGLGVAAHGVVNTWNGNGGSSRSSASWSIGGGPGTSDTASFTDAVAAVEAFGAGLNVPEPASMAVVTAGIGLFITRRRRRLG